MFLTKHLTKLGLSEKESEVYLAALELSGDSVQNIAKKAQLKRPTVYVIIDSLLEKGLLYEEKKGRGSLFIPADPQVLTRKLEEQKKGLQEALPFLRAMYSEKKSKPQVQVFEGKEAMRQVYLDAVWKSTTEVLFFGSIKKIYETFPNLLDILQEDVQGSQKYQHKIRELINPDTKDIEYGLKTVENVLSQVRVLPKSIADIFPGTDNAIFEDKFFISSFDDKLFTTVIQSRVIADTMRTLYELAWQQAIPIETYVKDNK